MAKQSHGTLLKLGDGEDPEVFTTIAEVKDIAGLSISADSEDVTSHDSEDGWAEQMPTLLHGGEFSFDVNLNPTAATHGYTTGVLKDLVDRQLRNIQFVFTDTAGTTWTAPGYFIKFDVAAPVAGVTSASITFEVSGKPTLA